MLLAFQHSTYGQRSNTKNINIKYVRPPWKPLSKDLTAYFVEFDCKPTLFKDKALSDAPGEQIKLSGYTRVYSKTEADILISMTINSLTRKTKIDSQVFTKKQDDGTKKDTKLFYGTRIATMNSTVFVKDLKSNRVLLSEENHETKDVISTQGLDSKQEVNADLASRDKTNQIQYTKTYRKRLDYFVKRLDSEFGIPVLNKKMPIARGKGKKRYNYSDLEDAFERFKNVTSNKQFVTDDSDRATLIECIKAWEKAADEYDEKVKRARINEKIVGALYQNIAYAYFMLKDWDNIYLYCEKAKVFKGHNKRASAFHEFTRQLYNRYKINNML